MKADKYIIRFINKGNVLVMYNSSRTILVQEVNNHDWFFYKLSGQSLNNGSIFSIQNNIFICEIYTGFPMPMMLLHLQDYVILISCNMCACATCLPVDSCACCTVHLTDVARQKKNQSYVNKYNIISNNI